MTFFNHSTSQSNSVHFFLFSCSVNLYQLQPFIIPPVHHHLTRDTGRSCERKQHSHTGSSTKKKHNFLQPNHFYSSYKSTKGYINGLLTRKLQRVYNRSGNSNLSCTYTPTSWTTLSSPLSSTDKGHYLPPSQVLPSLQKPLHSASTYARDLSKTNVIIYLT